MDHIRRVVIGLGSNVGDRVQHITRAIDALRGDEQLLVTEVSPYYETVAEGAAGPQAFVNGAVLVLTSLDAADLLQRLHGIEERLGRPRPGEGAGVERSGPRTIDLDILWIEGETIRRPDLVVPHERLSARAFMLRPLLDVAADARDAESGLVFSELPLAATELKRL